MGLCDSGDVAAAPAPPDRRDLDPRLRAAGDDRDLLQEEPRGLEVPQGQDRHPVSASWRTGFKLLACPCPVRQLHAAPPSRTLPATVSRQKNAEDKARSWIHSAYLVDQTVCLF